MSCGCAKKFSSKHFGDKNGVTLYAFSCPIPLMDDTSAEILALHRSIKISLNNNQFKKYHIEIESKSQEAVKWCANLSIG